MMKYLMFVLLYLCNVSCHVSGQSALTFHYNPTSISGPYSTSTVNWAKLRQQLIKDNGKDWYLEKIYRPGGYISICFSNQSDHDKSKSGLFICCSVYRDSAAISRIKNSIINLSMRNETFYTNLNLDRVKNKKYLNDTQYKDSVLNDAMLRNRIPCINLLIETGPNILYFGDINPTGDVKWVSGIERISTADLFYVKSIEDEYIRECHRLNTKPLLSTDDISDCNPDGINLLFKHIEANDNYLINTSTDGQDSMIDFEFDTDMTYGKDTCRSVVFSPL